MSVCEKVFALLILQKTKGIGIRTAHKLIHHYKTPAIILEQSPEKLTKEIQISEKIIADLFSKNVKNAALKELEYAKKQGFKIIPYGNDSYPYYLKQCSDAPLLLFQRGEFDLTNNRILSVVGTRNMTSYGAKICRNIIEELAPYRPIIVSGFAAGVDITAHLAAMDFGLETVGVLGHGFGFVFPKNHSPYVSKVLKNGSFITEYWSDIPPFAANFLTRNRIVAGISCATLVVESPLKSGALSTANWANDYNREVFAIGGRITDLQSQGCNALIKNHKAHLITSAEDIALAMGWENDKNNKKKIQKLPLNLSKPQQKIMDILKKRKEHLDMIVLKTGMPTNQVLAILFELEMQNIVKPLAGKYYEL